MRSIAVLIAVGMCCHLVAAAPGRYIRQSEGDAGSSLTTLELNDNEINPINAEAIPIGDLERNKRKLPSDTFEAKNAVLGFVFGIEHKRVKRDSGKEYPPDTPELDRTNVSLDLPDGLFNKIFGTATDSSQIISRLIMTEHKRVKRASGKVYPADTPEFDRNNVSLDFPDGLFNKSFATLTSASKVVSRLIMNSARRYSRFVLFFKPIFGDALVVKGFEDPTTTTTTTTTPKPNDSFNEI